MKRILLRMPNWIGDFVMGVPVLHDLRERFPQAEITVLAKAPFLSLLEKDPHVTHLLPLSPEAIQEKIYDVGVLLTNSFSSALQMYRGKVAKRIGFYDFLRRPLINYGVALPVIKSKQHLVITYKMLLERLGIERSQTQPKLFLSQQEIEDARSRVPRGKKIVGINPGAAYGSAKCWLPERFREVASELLAQDATVLFFGDDKTKELVDTICKDLPVINLAGKTSLRELMAFIYICDKFLTNDSGPMHIAAALGVPLVALFGSTDPIQTGPYPNGLVIQKKVSCAPCFRRTCPIDFRCMKQISSKEVIDLIRR